MPELCTESEIAELVDRFYSRVRADSELGPVFAAHVEDWSHHLPKMIDFWSSALRKTARYRAERIAQSLWYGYQMRPGCRGRASITRGLHKSGRKCCVEMSFALVHDASGAVLGSIAVARDVSERIEREKQAAAAAAAPKTP